MGADDDRYGAGGEQGYVESGAGGDRAIAGGYDGRYGESARGTLEHDGLGRAGHPGLVVDGDCDRTGISF